MYTPNHTRRPRPPGSIAHRPQPSTDSSQSAMSIFKPGPLASLVSSTSLGSLPESPLSGHDRKRKDARPERINLQDLANVSLDLDVSTKRSANQMQSSESIPSVASLRSLGEVAPSPPPPYGGMAPDTNRSPSFSEAPTPPMQDSGLPSQESSRAQEELEDVEEDLRAQRASDAAKVLGLNIDFENRSQGSPKSERSSESMSEGTMRAKMREMKRQMRRREQELVMAAQFAEEALQTQEQLLAYLPAHVVASISSGVLDTQHLRAPTLPSSHSISRGMSSSSSRSDVRTSESRSPSRPFRTVRQNDPGLPFPLHQQRPPRPRVDQHFVSHLPSRSTAPSLQQEVADERISVLEQALLEARESEENQRKVAVRLRKEMEKLQRHAERAEEEIAAREVEAPSQNQTPRGHSRDPPVWRGATPERVVREGSPSHQPTAYGWGSTAFPSFPTRSSFRTKINVTSHDTDEEPDLGDGTDRLRRMSVGSRGMSPSSLRSFSQSSSQGRGTVNSMANRSSSRLTPTVRPHSMSRLSSGSAQSDGRKLRKKVSQSNFLEPTATHSRSSSSEAYSTCVSGESSSSQSGKTARYSAPASARSSSFRRSPWPSPHPSPIDLDETYDEYPFPTLQSTLRLEATPRPSLSPAFASLSQRMENMRAFVSSALDPHSTFSKARGRTLGSELGDESSSWDISMKAIEQSLMRVTKPSEGSDTEAEAEDVSILSQEMLRQESEESETVDQSFVSDGEGQTPAPLPPHISAALNSLALALAPATVSPLNAKLSEVERSTLMDKISKTLPRIKWALDIVSPLAGKGIPLPEVLPGANRNEESSDPWSNDEAPIAGPSRKAEYRLSLPLPPRPALDRHTSSDGSIALAHRRRSSQQVPTFKDFKRRQGVLVQSEFGTVEMQTIPGRLVHDFICLMAIMMEILECTVVIVFRVVIDVRYNRKSSIGMDKRSRSQRYYF